MLCTARCLSYQPELAHLRANQAGPATVVANQTLPAKKHDWQSRQLCIVYPRGESSPHGETADALITDLAGPRESKEPGGPGGSCSGSHRKQLGNRYGGRASRVGWGMEEKSIPVESLAKNCPS